MITVLLLLAIPGYAATEELPQSADLPVEITARQMEASQQLRQAIFSGDVVVAQGDITLYCDQLTVFSLPEGDQVDRMEAVGNVRVVQLDRTAAADRAIYRQQAGTLELLGNASVHQEHNQVAGDEIMLFLQEDRSVVKSRESGRVRAVLFPQQKKDSQ